MLWQSSLHSSLYLLLPSPSMMESGCIISGASILSAFLILYFSPSTFVGGVLEDPYPNTANRSSSWINTSGELLNSTGRDTLRPILVNQRENSNGPGFICGFYCESDNNSCLFSVLIFQTIRSPKPVWSANRNRPVGLNATLQLTGDGNLILADADGSFVWSTNTSSKSVSALNLTETGNLMLIHGNNETVWQSFDHPTDSLVLQQKLIRGKKLISSQGMYSLSVTTDYIAFQVESDPPQIYFFWGLGSEYIKYDNGSIYAPDRDSHEESGEITSSLFVTIPTAVSAQYMTMESDGHLRVYQWLESEWREATDLMPKYLSECGYPLVCGKYGICSAGQCTCSAASSNGTIYFRAINERQPNLGCSLITPISCQMTQYHTLLELQNTSYFAFQSDSMSDMGICKWVRVSNVEICKQTCLNNCSCKAAVFRYGSDSMNGDCCLLHEVFTFENMEASYSTSSLFLKVQNSPLEVGNGVGKKARGNVQVIVGSSLGALFGVFILIGAFVFLFWKTRDEEEDEEHLQLDCMPLGMSTRFSYQALKAITQNFSCKLGEGGFGSVFEGTLTNGTKVAVKLLQGLGQVKKSFLAEVETIGSIHHVNLVRLIGFCAEKSHRLLVYEYMCNGSLDKWIFHGNQQLSLGWECRRKIILDIAKGLSYLHEDCRKKIIHLDIKPQNILLDEDFNAKVADFGLSKLIEKDQSEIVTIMRGTPGYLAPEWLSSSITEKVDVYSFGVVVLEILCGRKNIDRDQAEENKHLLAIFKRKAEENRLTDMIDKISEDMQLHEEDAMEMMKVGAWCLQSDFARRPSMSVVVKVLEGLMDVEDELEYNFSYSPLPPKFAGMGNKAVNTAATTLILASTLSGPR